MRKIVAAPTARSGANAVKGVPADWIFPDTLDKPAAAPLRFLVFLWIVYWIFLTVLLLIPQPHAVVGLQSVPIFSWGKFGIHLGFFILLGILANFSRWPKRLSGRLIAFMAIYGVVVENLQLLIPHRTARIMDGFENLFGIALGSGIYWCIWRLRGDQKAN